MRKGGMPAILLLLLAAIAVLCSCEEPQMMEAGGSLEVRVVDPQDSKMLAPAGSHDVTHHLITVENAQGEKFVSGHLEKGKIFSILYIPVGQWKVTVEACIERMGPDGVAGYETVAMGFADDVSITAGMTSEIVVTVDTLVADSPITVSSMGLLLPGAGISPTSISFTDQKDGTRVEAGFTMAVGQDEAGGAMAIVDLEAEGGGDLMLDPGIWRVDVTAAAAGGQEWKASELLKVVSGMDGDLGAVGMFTGYAPAGGYDYGVASAEGVSEVDRKGDGVVTGAWTYDSTSGLSLPVGFSSPLEDASVSLSLDGKEGVAGLEYAGLSSSASPVGVVHVAPGLLDDGAEHRLTVSCDTLDSFVTLLIDSRCTGAATEDAT